MKNTNQALRCFYSVALTQVLILSGCMSYFKTNSTVSPTAYQIQSVIEQRKMVIVHYRDKTIELKDVTLLNDRISGIPNQVSPVSSRYLHPKENLPNRYKKDHWAEVMSQVHIYINDQFPESTDKVAFSRNNITRLDAYSYDRHATNSSKALGALLIVGVVIGAVVAGVHIFNVPISFF
jgi:hypothetical protein